MRYTSIMRAAAKPNLTGFDPQALAAASGRKANDPWARREQWRYTGMFSRRNRFSNAFPGFGIAAVAFAAYCTVEYFFFKDEHHGHEEEGHGEKHH